MEEFKTRPAVNRGNPSNLDMSRKADLDWHSLVCFSGSQVKVSYKCGSEESWSCSIWNPPKTNAQNSLYVNEIMFRETW